MMAHPPIGPRPRQVCRGLWLALSRTLHGMLAHIGGVLRSMQLRARGLHTLPAANARPTPFIPRDRGSPADVERVELQPDDDASHVFRRLQGPGSKILDLRRAVVSAAFFDRMADSWQAPPGMVPRLAIVLDYERWVIFRNVARSRLTVLTAREVEVEIVYGQLLDLGRLSAWFERGRLLHAMPAVVTWLRREWRVTTMWPWVLDVTARMIEATVSVEDVPHLLLEISDLAYACGESEGAAEAAKHAHTALRWIGDAPSATRCRALRALSATSMLRGETDAAVIHLGKAMTIAKIIEDASEEAWALVDLGMHALGCRRFAAAEAAFGRAALQAPAYAASLRAMIHQQLSLALAQQAKDDEAAQHAALSIALRSAPWLVPVHEEAGLRQRLQDQYAERSVATQSTRDS